MKLKLTAEIEANLENGDTRRIKDTFEFREYLTEIEIREVMESGLPLRIYLKILIGEDNDSFCMKAIKELMEFYSCHVGWEITWDTV